MTISNRLKTVFREISCMFRGKDLGKTMFYVSEWFESEYGKKLEFSYASFPSYLKNKKIAHLKADVEGMKYPIFIESSYSGNIFYWDWMVPEDGVRLEDIKL